MSKRNNQDQKSSLALAMAGGETVVAWAEKNQVARRTAQTWSRSHEVQNQVQRIRHRVLDRAVGRLSKNATAAADQIARLARKAESESVQLNAARAVLADLMSVANYATLEKRLAAIERRMRASRELPVPGSQQDQPVEGGGRSVEGGGPVALSGPPDRPGQPVPPDSGQRTTDDGPPREEAQPCPTC